ncbi:MAG: four helix bundle protein [Gammaproteobacteria bacterium]
MDDVLGVKSYSLALRVFKLYKYLQDEHKEYVLSKQVLRSGTSIGALIKEAQYAQSRKDFINKLSISLKEANETGYWLKLLKDSNYISEELYACIEPDVIELIKILTSSINTTKENEQRNL